MKLSTRGATWLGAFSAVRARVDRNRLRGARIRRGAGAGPVT